MSNNNSAAYKRAFTNFDIVSLTKLAQFITVRNNATSEPPLIVVASIDDKGGAVLNNFLCAVIAICGGHAVNLGCINKNMFLFAIKFLSANSGLYINSNQKEFEIECFDSSTKYIENFQELFEKFNESLEFVGGKVSGYAEIAQRYLKLF